MKEYDELVKALREAKKHFWTQPQIELYPMMEDAADAIEYLILQNEMAQHAIRGLDATCNWLIKENERLKDGYEAWKRDEEYEEWLHDDRPCPDFAREE